MAGTPRLDVPSEDWALLETLLQLVEIDTNYGSAWQNIAKRIRAGLIRTPAPPKDERADAIMSALEKSRTTPAPNITLAGEIKPGHRYLLSTDTTMTPEQADKAMAVLQERFPGSAFAVAYGIKLVEPQVWDSAVVQTRADLLDALKRARTKVNQEWMQAHEQSRIALSGAAYALDYLARELATPERDGAGALPDPSEPVAAASTPAPSRQVPNGSGYDTVPVSARKLTCTCGRINADSSADVPGSQWIPGPKDHDCPVHGCRCNWEQRVNVMTEHYSKPGAHHLSGCPMRQS